MKPYYEQDSGRDSGGRFKRGHKQPKSDAHRAALSAACRVAWATKRKRTPLGRKWTDSNGYVHVKVADSGMRWRLEHVLVVEQVIGRALRSGEIVHHVNGDRADNRIGNLYLCRDRAHHNDVHRSQDAALRELLARGLVVFTDGRYAAVLH